MSDCPASFEVSGEQASCHSLELGSQNPEHNPGSESERTIVVGRAKWQRPTLASLLSSTPETTPATIPSRQPSLPQDSGSSYPSYKPPTDEDGPAPDSGVDEPEAVSAPSAVTKEKKQQKMHRCELCGKDFHRPSGLQTHMNSHNRERPYTCEFPGCEKAFSVMSNARRHYRTHGVGPSPLSLLASASSKRPQYAVNFEAPITPPLPRPSVPIQAPFCIRWIATNVATRGAGWGVRQAKQSDVD